MGKRVKRGWTQADVERRDRILGAAKVKRIRGQDLAVAVGMSPASISRWGSGGLALAPEVVDRLEAFVAGHTGEVVAPAAGIAAGATREMLEAESARLEALAGDMPEDSIDPLGDIARRGVRAAVGRVLEILLTSPSPTAALRAAEWLRDTGYGKPVQRMLDMTPRPPAVDDELMAKLTGMLSGEAGQGSADGPEPSADALASAGAAGTA